MPPLRSHPSFRAGVRAGMPLAAASLALSTSFGVIAEPVIGGVEAIVMSIIVFAGSAQFAVIAVLAAGGGPVAAVAAGSCSTCASCRWASPSLPPWMRGRSSGR